MFKPLSYLLALFLLVSVGFASAGSGSTPAVNLPLSFEVNRGQTAPQVKYLAVTPSLVKKRAPSRLLARYLTCGAVWPRLTSKLRGRFTAGVEPEPAEAKPTETSRKRASR